MDTIIDTSKYSVVGTREAVDKNKARRETTRTLNGRRKSPTCQHASCCIFSIFLHTCPTLTHLETVAVGAKSTGKSVSGLEHSVNDIFKSADISGSFLFNVVKPFHGFNNAVVRSEEMRASELEIFSFCWSWRIDSTYSCAERQVSRRRRLIGDCKKNQQV
jgi:hypothetical protein